MEEKEEAKEMKVINEIKTIRAGIPDDIFIVCSSFEERCFGAIRRLSKFKSKCSIIVNFFSDTNRKGEIKKRQSTGQLLKKAQSIDVKNMPRLISIEPYNYPELIERINKEIKTREIKDNGLHITIDISCFTKIQLMFLIKYFIESEETKIIRLLYTLPNSYNLTGNKFRRLSIGYYRPISIPFKIRMNNGVDTLKKVAVLEIGYEGERILSVWRSIEANKTLLLIPTSEDKILMNATERANSVLLRRARSGEPIFKDISCYRLDIDTAYQHIKSFCEQERKNGNTLVSIIPIGPKPFAIASLLCALKLKELSFEISYAIPTGYSDEYSEGIKEVYSYIIQKSQFE